LPARPPVEIRLLAEPTRLRMDERDQFRVGLVATNTTDEPIDPQLFAARLLVNGEPSTAFDFATGNGVVPAGWDVLPAGGTTRPVEYRLGEALFPEPGEYGIVLRLDVPGSPAVEDSRTVLVTD
jgi:hypothetical protein